MSSHFSFFSRDSDGTMLVNERLPRYDAHEISVTGIFL